MKIPWPGERPWIKEEPLRNIIDLPGIENTRSIEISVLNRGCFESLMKYPQW